METSAVPVQSHACIFRQLRRATQYTRVRNTKATAYVTFGRAAVVLPLLKKHVKEFCISAYEVELPENLQGMNQQDRANATKMILEVAVEIYKKQFPPATFEFSPRMCNKVHVGGELQAVVNLLAHTVMSNKNETRLQTLKIAIKNSEVSVLPLVYLYTMADFTTGVMNAYPQSQYRVRDKGNPEALNGYIKVGEYEVGASNTGVVLKKFSDKMAQSSCDALSLRDPRIFILQENERDSYSQPTTYNYEGDAFHLQHQQQLQQKQQANSPKWLKSYCVDVLSDLYRSVNFNAIQSTRHTPVSVLGGIETCIPVIQNALFPSSVPGEQSPMMSYLSVIRNCVDTMEAVASDIVSAHVLSQDLIPLPFHFHRYVLPSLYNAPCVEDAKQTLVNFRNVDSEALIMNCNVNSLLSAQTKKKARLASLLYKSEEASRRFENPPRNTRNMKEFEEPKTLQRKIEENSEVNMDFLEDLTEIFGAHDNYKNTTLLAPSTSLYAAEVEGLGGVRLETMEPTRSPPVGIHTGLSGDCGAETGGLPPNELQQFIHDLCARKATKSRKRKIVHDLLSPTALATVGILLEELATEMVLSWKQRIDDNEAALSASTAPALTSNPSSGTSHAPSSIATSDTTMSTTTFPQDDVISGTKRLRETTTMPLETPALPSPAATVPVSLPPPLLYDALTFSREVDLQLQGADVDGGNSTLVEAVLRNRMEVLFGVKEVNTPANIALIQARITQECAVQQRELEEHTAFFRQECKKTKEALPRKRYKF